MQTAERLFAVETSRGCLVEMMCLIVFAMAVLKSNEPFGDCFKGKLMNIPLNRKIEEAEGLLEQAVDRGLVYNALMRGLCKKMRFSSARDLLAEMLSHNIALDQYVYASLIDGSIRNENFDEAKDLFESSIIKSEGPVSSGTMP
ncbi:pentatricopeptide repeat-containing protein At1g52620-like [Punica granatum]|uniref:Pentatricopeptide repeat-containing protein At1g52620-like n=1 Tax=Punica granatum TaxID=22663 RepID=A0A6P8D531_PUNGR|nr:pentatricopeptide repeat-containing protein At1g52620-like [Punica granatum]